jgi:hypothetical protein
VDHNQHGRRGRPRPVRANACQDERQPSRGVVLPVVMSAGRLCELSQC